MGVVYHKKMRLCHNGRHAFERFELNVTLVCWCGVPENVVKNVYEEYHAGTFRDAIRLAAEFQDGKKSWKTFQGIIRAIEMAYLALYFDVEILPKPKVNILHRGLDQIAKAAGLEDLTEEGFAEFLDDVCPCGIKHHKEAVRKLSSRSA